MVRKLSATRPLELPEPRIDEADADRFISLEHLRQGITMRLPSFSATPGTRVSLAFSGHHYFRGEVVVEDPEADIVISIPPAEAIQFAGVRRIGLQAVVWTDAPVPELSPTVAFHAGAEAYAPIVDEAIGGVLPGSQGTIPGSVTIATVRIKAFENMAAGDRVRLYLLSSAPNGSAVINLEVESSDIGKDITFVTNISAYRNDMMYIVYEVDQPGRTLTPPSAVFRVEGQIGRVRPAYAIDSGYCDPSLLPLTYEAEGCVPINVTIPDNTIASDRVTLFMVPLNRFLPAIVLHHVIEDTVERDIRFCVPYDLASKYFGTIVHVGCILEYLSGGGATISGPITEYGIPG